MMSVSTLILILVSVVSSVVTTTNEYNLREDNLGYDPKVEVVHLYRDQWPTGIAVSQSGRKFSCYPGGFDSTNTYTGFNDIYQVAELTGSDTETAYPNVSYSQPPGGSIDYTQTPPATKGLTNYFLSVQSVVIDYDDVLWLLDAGRVTDPETSILLLASPGGPKLISIDLTTDEITGTYLFPTSVATPHSYLNDVRFDTQRHFAYITDSSDSTNENGLIVIDLATGDSWRALARDRTVTGIFGTVPFVVGKPLYDAATYTTGSGFITIGSDGIALSADTETLYYCSIAGRFLYSVPTGLLRNRTSNSELASAVRNLGEKGTTDGLATDSNGIVYAGNAEQSGVSMFDPETGRVVLFVRDKRIIWVDTFSVGADGYLYFIVNQWNYLPVFYRGPGLPRDERERPFGLFRAKLQGGATKGPGS